MIRPRASRRTACAVPLGMRAFSLILMRSARERRSRRMGRADDGANLRRPDRRRAWRARRGEAVDLHRRPAGRAALRAALDQGWRASVRGDASPARPRAIWSRRSRASRPARRPSASTASSSMFAREKLPATDENEYYHADLIGLAAVTTAGRAARLASSRSTISAPATSSRSHRRMGPPCCCRSTNAVVPTVDLAGGRVVIELPDEIEGDGL